MCMLVTSPKSFLRLQTTPEPPGPQSSKRDIDASVPLPLPSLLVHSRGLMHHHYPTLSKTRAASMRLHALVPNLPDQPWSSTSQPTVTQHPSTGIGSRSGPLVSPTRRSPSTANQQRTPHKVYENNPQTTVAKKRFVHLRALGGRSEQKWNSRLTLDSALL